MKQQSDDETELRRYLLGELTEEERAQVKERLFLNSDYFQQLQAAEDDLIDDYVYEELSVADRESFETHFLSQPGRHEDLKFAQALKMYISTEAPPSSAISAAAVAIHPPPTTKSKVMFLPFLRNFSNLARLSLAAATLIILAVGIWLVIRAVRNRDQSPPIQAQRPTPQETVPDPQQREVMPTNSQPGKSQPVEQEQHVENRKGPEPPRPREPSPQSGDAPGSTLAVLLIPGGGIRGGGETNKVTLTSAVRLVNLQMPLIESNDYRSYQVSLQADGRVILTRSGLKATVVEEVNLVPVPVPARLLRRKSYLIKLSGVTKEGETRDIATYAFQVEGS